MMSLHCISAGPHSFARCASPPMRPPLGAAAQNMFSQKIQVVGKLPKGSKPLLARARVTSAASTSESSSPVSRGLIAAALAAGLVLTPVQVLASPAQAATAEEMAERRAEMRAQRLAQVQAEREEREAQKALASVRAPPPEESPMEEVTPIEVAPVIVVEAEAETEAAALKAAAEERRAAAKALASQIAVESGVDKANKATTTVAAKKNAPEQSNNSPDFLTFTLGRLFGMGFLAAAIILAREYSANPDSTTDILTEKLQSSFSAMENKPIVLGYAAGFAVAVSTVDFISNLPILNLLFPSLFQAMGIFTAGSLAYKYVYKSEGDAEVDLKAAVKSVAKQLPGPIKDVL